MQMALKSCRGRIGHADGAEAVQMSLLTVASNGEIKRRVREKEKERERERERECPDRQKQRGALITKKKDPVEGY